MFEHRPPVFHGTKVGLAIPGVIALWYKLINEDIDFEQCKQIVKAFDYEKWEALVKDKFEGAANGVIALEKKAGKNNIESALNRIDTIANKWEDIKTVIKNDLPKPEYVVQILKSVQAAYRPEQVGIDEMMTKDSLILAKEVRVRYGLLQLLWDLGLLEDYSNAFVQYYRSN